MMSGFDEMIHQPLRLKIMAALCRLSHDDRSKLDFNHLKEITKATDGNLGAHIQILEKVSYIRVEKTFIDKRPNTAVFPTEEGRKAFDAHIEALTQLISGEYLKR